MKAYICASILLCFFIQFYSASAIKIDGLDDKVDANVTLESSCGGNCPSGGCPNCLCGSSPNDVSISSWCSQYGSWSQGCCQCIASHESGGNANAENYNSNGSYDIGLWQINDMNWPDCSSGEAPCNPSTNLNCAIMIWQWGGHTWKYWSTCGVCGCCNSP